MNTKGKKIAKFILKTIFELKKWNAFVIRDIMKC